MLGHCEAGSKAAAAHVSMPVITPGRGAAVFGVALARRSLGRALEALLQSRHIDRHLPSCLAAHEERHEESTDAVPLEVEGDRKVRAGV